MLKLLIEKKNLNKRSSKQLAQTLPTLRLPKSSKFQIIKDLRRRLICLKIFQSLQLPRSGNRKTFQNHPSIMKTSELCQELQQISVHYKSEFRFEINLEDILNFESIIADNSEI